MSRKITPTYTLLNQITLAAASSSVTFSNIPQNYGDLVLVMSGKRTGTGGVVGLEIYFNNDETASNYSNVSAYGWSPGTGSGAGSNLSTGIGINQGQISWQIIDYSAIDKHKPVLSRYDFGPEEVGMVAGRWANTSAITSILLKDSVAAWNLAAGSTFSLYGLVV